MLKDFLKDFLKDILYWSGGAGPPPRAENSQREGGPAWAGLSSVRPFVRYAQQGPKRASKSLKFHWVFH